MYFVSGSQAQAYDYSGVRQSGDDIELGAGRWHGGATIFDDDTDTVTVPSAPTSLALTKTHNSISATFAAPTDLGGADLIRYDIRIDSGTWIDTGLDLAHTFSSLSAETEYTVEVAAVNSAGRGAGSSLNATTNAAPVVLTVPSAPQNLTATADSNGTSVELDWDVPSDDGGTSITDYQYSRDGGSTFIAIGATDTDYTVTGLDKNTEYDFQVRAVNSEGSGTATATVSETTEITTASAPTSLTVTVPTNGTSLSASWTAPSDDGGELTDYDYSTDDGATWNSTGATSTAYTITGLDKGTEYDVKVRAVNSAGDGTASSTVTKTTDTTVPNAPTSLSATADTNGTEIDLSWTAPTDDGGTTITGYQYSTDDGSTYTDTVSTTTTHTITGLDKNTEYTLKVRATNAEGNGTASGSATQTTDTTVPNAPTSLSLTVGETTANLSWTAPTDDGGDTITSYEVSSDDGTTWTDTGDADLTYQITGLTADTEYDFKVRAVNGEGSGTASATVTETTNAVAITVPAAPTSLTVTVPTNGTSLSASWTAPSGTVTDYEYSTDNGTTWNSTGSTSTSYTITGLEKGTEYNVKVRAVNSAGNSTATATVTKTTNTTVPSAPTSFSIAIGDTDATLTWATPTDDGGTAITEYQYSTDDGATWTDTNSTNLQQEVTGLVAETEYDFKVRAVNAEGNGTASATVTKSTLASATTATEPQIITAVQVQNRTVVRWEAPDNFNNGTLERYELRIDREAWIQGNTEEHHTLLDLGIGEHSIEVSAITEAGRGAIGEIAHTVRFEATPQEQIQTYTFDTRDGQTLSQILHQEFSYIDTELLSEVLDLNPGLANEPLKLTIGTEIKLPVKETPTAQTIPVLTLWD